MVQLYEVIFYTLSAIILIATLMAITRGNTVHAVVYLVLSFCGTALLFYLLGAPLLAALEVIIYAGAIMVLFLFILMTMRTEEPTTRAGEESPVDDETPSALPPLPPYDSGLGTQHFPWGQWLFPSFLGCLCLAAAGFLIFGSPGAGLLLMPAMASPAVFGSFLFENYWFPVEIVSFLLFVALVGALYLGRREGGAPIGPGEADC